MDGALVLLRTKSLRDVGAFIVAHIYEIPLLLFDHDGSIVRRLTAPEFTAFVNQTADPSRAHRRAVLALVQANSDDIAFLPVGRFLQDQNHPDRIREDLASLFAEQKFDLVGDPSSGATPIPADWNPAVFNFDFLRVHGFGRTILTPGIQDQLNGVTGFMDLCNVLGKNRVSAPERTSRIPFIRSFFIRTGQNWDMRWWSYLTQTTPEEVYDYSVTDELVQSTFSMLYDRIKDTYGTKGLEAYLVKDTVFRDTYNFNLLARDLVTGVSNPLLSTYQELATRVVDPITQLSFLAVIQNAYVAVYHNESLGITSPYDSEGIVRSALGIPAAVEDVASTWMFVTFVIMITILAGLVLAARATLSQRQKVRETVATMSTWINVVYSSVPSQALVVRGQTQALARSVQAGTDVAVGWFRQVLHGSPVVRQLTQQEQRIVASRRLLEESGQSPPPRQTIMPAPPTIDPTIVAKFVDVLVWASMAASTLAHRAIAAVPAIQNIQQLTIEAAPASDLPATPPQPDLPPTASPLPPPADLPPLADLPPPASPPASPPAAPPPPPRLAGRFARLGSAAQAVLRVIPARRGDPNPFHLTDSSAPLVDLLFGRRANITYAPVADYQQLCRDYLAGVPSRPWVRDQGRLTDPELWPGLSDAVVERGILAFWHLTMDQFSKTPPKKMRGPDYWLIRCILS